ncbi:MAG: glycosyltransferase family 4 protein [candidate division KSB1 bacterium]|nr:glycosyltransferase family 4 protein [candidate division KSB1 bacterium]MDZ7341272.1 glycosyltransferase family 4 protein [candidate division KSB1 bacterium]
MKILFLSTENPYPPDHGHHIRTLNILEGLAKQNEIYFIGFAQHQKELAHCTYLENLCKNVLIFRIKQGIFKWRYYLRLSLNLFSRYPYTVQRYLMSDVKKAIAQMISKNDIDLVHVDMLHLAAYHDEIGERACVLVDHNVESLRMRRWMTVETNIIIKLYIYFQYLKLKHFEKQMCAVFDRCVVVSDVDKEILCKMTGTDNFTVIPNGVDTEYFKPGNTNYDPYGLVWVGGMEGPYNRDAVIFFIDDIFPLIETKIPTARVTFVGASPPAKLIKKAKENSNVKVVGYVDDVRPYVDQAAIFVAPIRSGSGTKIKILNALAQQKAVVTTSIGAEGIDIIPDQHFMIADSAREFADAIIYLFKNQHRIVELGRNGRKLVEEKYSWQQINRQVERLYQALVNGHQSASGTKITDNLASL